MATPSYTPNNWQAGQVLTAAKLNNTETGVSNAIDAIQKLEAPIVEAQTLAAGQSATATYQNGKWSFGIPQGAAGANGQDGAAGEPGSNGANGSSFRVSATALSDNKADIAADALAPSNAVIAYKIGDIVLDATTKKLYAITAVSGGVATIGTAIATLP